MTRARDLADLASSGVIEGTEVADDAITLAKMASGTDGNVISYDASGNPVAIATGSDGQVLTSTGAGSPPAFEAIPSSAVDISGQTEESGTLATGDELLIYDASATANRRINVANFLKSAANRTTTSIGTVISAQPDAIVAPSGTISGSNIVYSHTGTAVGVGTWRGMGHAGAGDRTVFLRIS